ncbi:MAG: hypothetical protein LBK04_04565 [Clostridiales Family XIII bacterium]|nr:hypothetical protein [Clostridiales Family XIII bacterium]
MTNVFPEETGTKIIRLEKDPRFAARELFHMVKKIGGDFPGRIVARDEIRSYLSKRDFGEFQSEFDDEVIKKKSELDCKAVAECALEFAVSGDDLLASLGITLVRRFPEELKIDINPLIFEYLKVDPIGRSEYLSYLLYSDAWMDAVLSVYRDALPPGSLAFGEGAGSAARLIEALEYYPSYGLDYVSAGLLSDVEPLRRAAVNCASKWKTIAGRSIDSFAPALAEDVKALLAEKLDDELRYKLIDLLE